jgi:hypothetical protein
MDLQNMSREALKEAVLVGNREALQELETRAEMRGKERVLEREVRRVQTEAEYEIFMLEREAFVNRMFHSCGFNTYR